ncbi:YchJ family protein [Insolitispirillum peregrinum]|uniref:SEC-C motif-containing protein n=1 Tax=Insolitispirillum peregrinum TaxID=80876 RepID=A0A1N7PJT5_9PROT|nr:YchJ family protein [Insolitispirillum peregrinum]SIT10740.1 SEC-C motif-containing protein [Insolitispirillum peregrinum]
MTSCSCGSSRPYAECCEPFISGAAKPETAEQLMRSRYTAFAVQSIDYLQQTLTPDTQGDFDRGHVSEWAANSEWLGLNVLSTEAGGADDEEGWVEFVARFKLGAQTHTHHETGHFRKLDGQWYYADGISGPRTVRKGPKIGRNDPCTCGSGKKYKKCCGAAA